MASYYVPVPTVSGRSTISARACVNAQRWFPEENMAETALKILQGQSMETFRFVSAESPENPLPPEWKIESELVDMDSMTSWLWAYWEGRWRGYWQD
jgi:hypothetical protein